jgi:hypothetical protein
MGMDQQQNNTMQRIKEIFVDSRTRHLQKVLGEDTDPHARAVLPDMFAPTSAPSEDGTKSTIIGHDVMSDIEMFDCFDSVKNETVFNCINHCQLEGGTMYLRNLIEHPISDADLLIERQKNLVTALQHFESTEKVLHDIREFEPDVLWLFEQRDKDLVELYDTVFFRSRFLRFLNGSPAALTSWNVYRIFMSPTIGLLTPVLYFIVPYLILRWRYSIVIPFVQYLRILKASFSVGMSLGSSHKTVQYASMLFSLVFYFQSMFNVFEVSKTLLRVSKTIMNRVDRAGQFLARSSDLIDSTGWSKDIWFDQSTSSAKIDYSKTKITNRFHFGKQLSWFKNFDRVECRDLVINVYMLDAVTNALRLQELFGVSPATFVEEKLPFLQAIDLWHPSIGASSIKNRISLGLDSEPANVILTGPNACGKSTVLKSILINTILAQTITVCFASQVNITPFENIDSHMHVPDDKGHASLFEAEMYRCAKILEKISVPDKKNLVIVDEIFASTNPVEGIAAGYAVAAELGKSKNTLSIVSTHYTYLSNLQKRNGTFKNLRMIANIDKNGAITYPYKLRKGVSRQYIALEIMKNKRVFSSAVIDTAIKIKNKFAPPCK